MNVMITPLDARTFRDRLPEALGVYVEAMGYPKEVIRTRASAWLEHSRRPHWSCWAALEHGRRAFLGRQSRLVGICYGYRGAPGQWWHDQVRRGLVGAGVQMRDNFVELTELHVSPSAQGQGIGSELIRAFLGDRIESTVMLSTPEVPGDPNAAWRLYRGLGFSDALRHFHFDADPRPFAVLERPLPLTTPAASADPAS